jgi:6-phosphogluconolactonase
VSRTELIPCESAFALAALAAKAWLDELSPTPNPAPFCVALSGGRSAREFFAATASLAQARRQALEKVHFFWADERCVPPADPESNYALACEVLLTPVGVAADCIHRIRGEAAPEIAAVEAEACLRSVASANRGQPVLDLILLGMGEDGHVASLFPGESAAAVTSPSVYRSVIGPKPPPRRITLGYSTIAAAKRVWVLVSSAGKAGALRASLAKGATTPLARVIAQRSWTRIYAETGLSPEKIARPA